MTAIAQIVDWQGLGEADRSSVLARPAMSSTREVSARVREIIELVRAGGDAALQNLTRQLDGVDLECIAVGQDEIDAAERTLTRQQLEAIDLAIANVTCFHEAQRPADLCVTTMPGVTCERVSHPIGSVGLYVPAGSAPLPSTAIMLAVPAAIAGCETVVLCTPPKSDGRADSAVLTAAARAGVRNLFKVGGAQAIAAMAFGTETVPKTDKIFGPGNRWVTEAKTQVAAGPYGAAIDMPAGPSEVLVIADDSASPELVAADLLSQAEHGADSQVILVTESRTLADQANMQIEMQLGRLSRREIAQQALLSSRIILVPDLQTAVLVSNRYAPEHLILQVRDPRRLLPCIRNAGSVFVGQWTPESAGDYCSGTNHVLPTYGHARSASGLGVDHFMRHMTVQEITRDGLVALSGAILELAQLEGLDAHAAAVRYRLQHGSPT